MLANNIRYCCIVCVGRYLVLRELVLCRQRMPDCNCIFECGHGRHFVLVRQRLRWWPQSDAAMPVQAPTQCLCHWHILRLFERNHAKCIYHYHGIGFDICQLWSTMRSAWRGYLWEGLSWCRSRNVVLHFMVLGVKQVCERLSIHTLAGSLLEFFQMWLKRRGHFSLQIWLLLWVSRATTSR